MGSGINDRLGVVLRSSAQIDFALLFSKACCTTCHVFCAFCCRFKTECGLPRCAFAFPKSTSYNCMAWELSRGVHGWKVWAFFLIKCRDRKQSHENVTGVRTAVDYRLRGAVPAGKICYSATHVRRVTFLFLIWYSVVKAREFRSSTSVLWRYKFLSVCLLVGLVR